MLHFILSPAKNLNTLPENLPVCTFSQPDLLEHAEILMRSVRLLSPQQLAKLMHISDKIAVLNTERNQDWQPPFTEQNAKAALFLFNGDVYDGIAARELNSVEIQYIQNTTRILSGLYGLLRPLDLIQPYRLEMGTPLTNVRGSNLYQFWGDLITHHLNAQFSGSNDILINLASQEYFKAVLPEKLAARIITPIFLDEKNGTFKIISFYAKRARGLMVRFAAQNALTCAKDLQHFDLEGYQFHPALSSEHEWHFVRHESDRPKK